MAIFDLPTAQMLFNKVGKLDEIDVAAAQRVSRRRSSSRRSDRSCRDDPGAKRRAGGHEADAGHERRFTGFLQKFLLAFGGIALFVGIFVIANTLSITIAQRAREFGTLRTLGATRRQVLSSVIVEGWRDRRARVGRRASSSASGSRRASRRCSSVRHRPAAAAARSSRRGRSSSRSLVGTIVTVLASLFPAFRGDARRADRGGSRRRAAAVAARALRAAGRRRDAGGRARAAALRRARDGRHRHRSACSRSASVSSSASSAWRCSHRRFVPPLASSLGWPGARVGGVAGIARARERDAQPGAHRIDGGGADDRARARDRGRRARVRDQGDVRARGRHAVPRRLCADVGERVHADRESPRRTRFAACRVFWSSRASVPARRARSAATSTSPASSRTSAA